MKEQFKLYIKDGSKERINFKGLSIIIENSEGSIRSGVDESGEEWQTIFVHPYGYIENTKGSDDDEIDCFVGDNCLADMVYIVHQLKEDGNYDEDKVLLGFDSIEAARDAYLAHYSTQGYIGKVTAMPFFEFKEKIEQQGKEGIRIS